MLITPSPTTIIYANAEMGSLDPSWWSYNKIPDGENGRGLHLYNFIAFQDENNECVQNADTLIQGEQHGPDNDVEHVKVIGSNYRHFNLQWLWRPGEPEPPHKRYSYVRLIQTATYSEYRDGAPSGYHPDDGLCLATNPLIYRLNDGTKNGIYISFYSSVRQYDRHSPYRDEPMYEELLFKLTDAPGYIRSTFLGTWAVLPIDRKTLRCYHDGRIYSDYGWRRMEVTIPLHGRDSRACPWNFTVLHGEELFKLVSKDNYYFDCLRLLPQFHASARSRAFEESCDGIGHISSNNIANCKQVLEVLGCIFNKDIDGILQIPKTIKDAWLWYRYQYSTTKLDIEEMSDKLRYLDFKYPGSYTAYTTFMDPREEVNVKWTCGVTVHEQWTDLYDKVNSLLYRAGLYPGLVNIWDMIPFSFVVDWILPIGDLAQKIETEMRFNSSRYVFDRINYSTSCSVGSLAYPGLSYCYYKRWGETAPPPAWLWVGEGTYDPSSKTWAKRAIDGLCLVVGKGG